MIHLDLTLAEVAQLQHALATLIAQSTQEDVVVALHRLLGKLAAASQLQPGSQLCPVCQQPFTQLNTGRLARYCSNACKQKAYRQRSLEQKRNWRPDWFRNQRHT
jgi:hypothetical protein